MAARRDGLKKGEIARGTMTTGDHSRFKLTRLAAKYAEMQQSGRILTNRLNIQLVRTRIEQLAERIDANAAPERLQILADLWDKYLHAPNSQIPGLRLQISEEFDKVRHDYSAWQQIFEAVKLDSELVETEVSILKTMRALLSAEDAYQLVATLQAAVFRAISYMGDEVPLAVRSRLLKRIEYEFTRIIGEEPESSEGADDSVEEGIDGSFSEAGDTGSGEVDREGILYPGDQG